MRGHWLALLTVLRLLRSDAARYRGNKYVPANSAVFIAKYCFDFAELSNKTGAGEVSFAVNGAVPKKGDFKVILLNDQQDSYPDSHSRWPGFDCGDERLAKVAKAQLMIHAKSLPSNNKLHTYIVERLRPRFWFLAILDCSGVSRTIDFDLHLLNIKQGRWAELSMDRCGISSLCLFLVVYMVLGLLQVHAIFLASTARTKHPLRLLLTFGIIAALWGIVFYAIDTFWYASTGEDSYVLYIASKLCKAWSKFTLLLILVLLSKGRCISTDLHLRDIFQAVGIVGPFCIVCVGLELWGEYDQSQKYTTSFVYVTWAGAVLVCADLALLFFYVRNLLSSWRRETNSDTKVFYCSWGLVYSSSFLSLPVSVIVAFFVAPWVRVETVLILNNSIHCVLLCLLVIGLWPDRTQKAFCIDKPNAELQCTFGNQAGGLLEDELKTRGGDYEEFNMEDSILANGNG